MDIAATPSTTSSKPRPRKWLRIILSLLILTLPTAAWFAGLSAWKRISYHNTLQTCLTYAPPPTQVVFETDPAAAAALYQSHPGDLGFYTAGDHAMFGSIPACAKRHASFMTPLADGINALVFMHERTSRGTGGGQRRLVQIRYLAYPVVDVANDALVESASQITLYSPRIFDPALPPGGVPTHTAAPKPTTKPHFPIPTRIYAGQADPADASHFTFDYESHGQRDTVDGWLEADDTVTLQPRLPPAPKAPRTLP